jgi:tRNA pseudouridine38-40 synthase
MDDAGLLCFEVTAESFLWHMVRYMAAALLLVGEWSWDAETLRQRLEGEEIPVLGPAPPENLVLWDVDCGIRFEPVGDAGRSWQFLQDRREYHTVMARICGALLDRGEG